jgi:hypothetical protein
MMFSGVQANPQWVPANNQPLYVLDAKQTRRPHAAISYGDRRDYVRRVGRQGRRRGLGPLGWIIQMPYDPGANWVVTTADDNVESNLASPPTVAKPPAGIK